MLSNCWVENRGAFALDVIVIGDFDLWGTWFIKLGLFGNSPGPRSAEIDGLLFWFISRGTGLGLNADLWIDGEFPFISIFSYSSLFFFVGESNGSEGIGD